MIFAFFLPFVFLSVTLWKKHSSINNCASALLLKLSKAFSSTKLHEVTLKERRCNYKGMMLVQKN